MILSMTGFGDAAIEERGHAYHVEVRSVNNRYLKIGTRLPEGFEFLEPELESRLRKRLTRGSVTMRLSYRDLSAEAAQTINVAAVQRYVAQLQGVMQSGFTLDVATIANLPGVCQPHEMSDDQRDACMQTVYRLLDQALDALLVMRKAEGAALADDLRRHCGVVRSNVDAIEALAGSVVREYSERLMARVRELIADSGVKLAEQDLIREVAVYAERSDISEEISRLRSHLDQFEACLSSSDPAGRRLDFISQELLREANTIGSKAGDAAIARHTIEIKAAIDRIKEQVQNAE